MPELGLKPELELSTERLRLRPVTEQDAEATAALMTAEVAANLTTWPPAMSAQMARDRIRLAEDRLAARQAVELAILDGSTMTLLGWIGIGNFPGSEEGQARIGFWLGRRFQGRGLMHEAGQAAIPAVGRFLAIHALEACVYPWNNAGIALIQKLGFDRQGTVELYSPVRERVERALLFGRPVAPQLRGALEA